MPPCAGEGYARNPRPCFSRDFSVGRDGFPPWSSGGAGSFKDARTGAGRENRRPVQQAEGLGGEDLVVEMIAVCWRERDFRRFMDAGQRTDRGESPRKSPGVLRGDLFNRAEREMEQRSNGKGPTSYTPTTCFPVSPLRAGGLPPQTHTGRPALPQLSPDLSHHLPFQGGGRLHAVSGGREYWSCFSIAATISSRAPGMRCGTR